MGMDLNKTAMDDAGRPLSRRAAVQGFGVLAGATVLAMTAVADPLPALATPRGVDGDPDGDSIGGDGLEAALVPTTPGLTYVNLTFRDFSPTASTAVTTTAYGSYCAGLDVNFQAPLFLPSGSVLKEFSVAGRNTSGSTVQPHLGGVAFGGIGTVSVVQALLTSGAIGVRIATNDVFSYTLDGQYGYIFTAPTKGDGSVTIHSARVGYVPATTPGTFTPLAVPVRIYDSRPNGLPAGGVKGRFADHEERVLDAKLGTTVPAGASSVLVNVTATNTNPGGFFSLFKNGVVWPGTSTLNWGVANTTVASLSATQLAANATFKARCEGPGGADLIVDVVGWFA
jgi:hypothetical protein